MENRRTNGRQMIARKLKFSQEFLMDSKLSTSPDVWTKWHEQRAGTTEMDRDLSNAPNQKYINVSPPSTILESSLALLEKQIAVERIQLELFTL